MSEEYWDIIERYGSVTHSPTCEMCGGWLTPLGKMEDVRSPILGGGIMWWWSCDTCGQHWYIYLQVGKPPVMGEWPQRFPSQV